MKIFLDDVRSPPDETWTLFKKAEDVLEVIATEWEQIEAISFDNDLGVGNMEGYRVLDVIEALVHDEAAIHIPHLPKLYIHSANPVARARMATVIVRLENFCNSCGLQLIGELTENDVL